MSRSLKANYFFNLVNSISQLIFPIITFPYASRVLLVEGIGQVDFFTSIISYVTLFTCLGIPMYAVREVARVRENQNMLSLITTEILLLHAFLAILGYLVVFFLCAFVPQIHENVKLFLILSSTIFFTAIGCEWFYQGIEDFKYVAIRGILVKVISVILLFCFVKTKDDLLIYGVYNVIGVLGGNIFNFIRLHKYINYSELPIKNLNPLRHLKPAIHIFAYNVIISVYLQLNSVLLGFLKDAVAVGYFCAATKVLTLTMRLSSSLVTVMIPRASNLLASNKIEEFKSVIQKSYDYIIAISLPLVIGLIFTSKSIILLLSGEEFIPSILASQIVSLNILTVGISGIVGLQVLYPLNKFNIVIISTLIGALTNVVLNILLVPIYGHYGTAFSYMFAEFVVTLTMCIIGYKYIPIVFIKRSHMNYIIASLFMTVVLVSVHSFNLSAIYSLMMMFILGVASYFIILYFLKDTIVLEILVYTKKLLKNI